MARWEAMLSAPAREWPGGGDWILQPKWDGFRVLVRIDAHRSVRARSRHGTDLTGRVGDLLRGLEHLAAGTVLDGELIALSDRDGRPAQDFAAVGRGVFGRDRRGADRLSLVLFDVLADSGADVRCEPWLDRDRRLRELGLLSSRIRAIDCLPATPSTHAELVALGFEGSVLKRPRSTYRGGRCSSWRKHKARHALQGELRAVTRGRDGKLHVVCDVDGRRVVALTNRGNHGGPGEAVTIIYSREDADGSLREARIAPTALPGGGASVPRSTARRVSASATSWSAPQPGQGSRNEARPSERHVSAGAHS